MGLSTKHAGDMAVMTSVPRDITTNRSFDILYWSGVVSHNGSGTSGGNSFEG